jgi:hypothetical protein
MWVKCISIHIFIKNKISIDSKNNVYFNIVVGFGKLNTKIQLTFIGIWIAYY